MNSKIINKILFTIALLLFSIPPFILHIKSEYTKENFITSGIQIAAFILLVILQIRTNNKLGLLLCSYNLIIRIILLLLSFTY